MLAEKTAASTALVTTTYSGAAVATIAGLTFNEWVAVGGLLVAIASFAVNIWYKKECLNLERRKLSEKK